MVELVPSSRLEDQLREEGYLKIAGIDEAGRGPLAGPVVAAACLIPKGLYFDGVNDSKKMTAVSRQSLYEQITANPLVIWGVGIISPEEIDRVNIFQATILAMLQAVENLNDVPDYLLVDGLKLPHPFIPSEKIIRGDQISHSIAAASIIAKVTRDKIMSDYDQQFPEYGFKKHKGYGTKIHLDALSAFGPTPIHRKSFRPVSEVYENALLKEVVL